MNFGVTNVSYVYLRDGLLPVGKCTDPSDGTVGEVFFLDPIELFLGISVFCLELFR